jgi:Flp pilus assembly protein TadG
MSRFRKHLFRKGQTGQTIVLLAIGFIVLLAFVGIVTDVSLMFVRYSSLRRAVDAAAVAAAGQVRRILPTTAETNKAQSLGGTAQQISDRAAGYAFARSYATVSLAARQFIELYGLNPTIVTVDTCYTLSGPPDKELNCDSTQPNWKPQKLVRVTAQIPSPTIFLRLIGWKDITLEASAVSQTASLDVVMIFDVSESMAAQTTYKDWSKIPNPSGGASIDKSMRFLAPRMVFPPNPAILATEDYNDFWQSVLNLKQADLDVTPRFQPKAFAADNTPGAAPSITNANPAANDPRMPRSDCRVKFFPSALKYAIPNGDPNAGYVVDDNLRGEYYKLTNDSLYNNFITFDGFRPTYNFYGCCNEPLDSELASQRRSQVDATTDNFIFSSLVCQPFQKVREATKGFLDHVDFVRGDRVAFATYDRGATLIKPEATTADPQPQAMITSQTAALNILNKAVGVHAEPFFYADTNNDNLWDAFVVGGSQYENCDVYTGSDKTNCLDRHDASKGRQTMTMTWDKTGIISATNPSGKPNTPGGFNGTKLGDMRDYAAKDDCFLQNATLEYPFSLWSAPGPTDNSTAATTAATGWMDYRWPSALTAKGKDAAGNDSIMHPNLNSALWENAMPASIRPNPALSSWKQNQLGKVKWNYEYRAGCRGGNVGAALRIGNNALVDRKTVRTDGSVWVMVLLGQGTAGASDPVRRGSVVPPVADPYGNNGYKGRPTAGEYGGYGVCPYGTPSKPSELVEGWEAYAPFCADDQPHTRHFCPFDPQKSDPDGSIYIDLGPKGSDCELKYDVDDFARDWADWVGLVDPLPNNGNVPPRNGVQLPTIFTIGFGYSFPTGFNCGMSNTDPKTFAQCNGEELMRYIADVGDNNRVDTDYEQDYRDNYQPDLSLPADQWGPNSPCEKQQIIGNNGLFYGKPADLQKAYQKVPPDNVSPDNLVRPIDAGLNCGNYFSAPAPDQLQPIFDEIASRMFTRISR